MASRSVVLSFHETLLHSSDVDLLTGPHWLNDTIISFYFEYLEKVIFSNAKDLLFVSPEVTQCIKMVSKEEIKVFLHPLGCDWKQFIFFALNDNDLPDRAGGTHWSLLVFSRPERQFFHFDSSKGSNHNVAWEFASHLIPFFANGSCDFVSKESLQQSNGYDCGIHVLCNADMIANHVLRHSSVASCGIISKLAVKSKRTDLLDIIEDLSRS